MKLEVPDIDEPFAFYLDRLRHGDGEAVFPLMDLGNEVLPLISRILSMETDSSVRRGLVHVAWQTRSPEAVNILSSSMDDPEPEVWKEAIDGLVVLGTPEAVAVLKRAREQSPNRPTHGRYSFSEWIDDALSQIQSSGPM